MKEFKYIFKILLGGNRILFLYCIIFFVSLTAFVEFCEIINNIKEFKKSINNSFNKPFTFLRVETDKKNIYRLNNKFNGYLLQMYINNNRQNIMFFLPKPLEISTNIVIWDRENAVNNTLFDQLKITQLKIKYKKTKYIKFNIIDTGFFYKGNYLFLNKETAKELGFKFKPNFFYVDVDGNNLYNIQYRIEKFLKQNFAKFKIKNFYEDLKRDNEYINKVIKISFLYVVLVTILIVMLAVFVYKIVYQLKYKSFMQLNYLGISITKLKISYLIYFIFLEILAFLFSKISIINNFINKIFIVLF